MTSKQNKHVKEITARVSALITTKYRAGQARHSDNLWDKTPEELIDEAIYEAVDQIVYLLTAKTNMDKRHGKHIVY